VHGGNEPAATFTGPGDGEVLFHRPTGAERHTPYTAVASPKLQAAVLAAVVQEHAVKTVPQGAQQQQPVVEQDVAQAAVALAVQLPVLCHAEPPNQPRETASGQHQQQDHQHGLLNWKRQLHQHQRHQQRHSHQ
jgi:hypothetical protein